MTDHDEVEVDATLEREATAPPAGGGTTAGGRQGSDRPTEPLAARAPIHLWGPVALGAAGVGLLAGGMVALARRGCTDHGPAGDCIRRRELAPVPFGLYVGGGAAAFIGAVVWLGLTRPGRASGSSEDERPADDPAVAVTVGPFGAGLRLKY